MPTRWSGFQRYLKTRRAEASSGCLVVISRDAAERIASLLERVDQRGQVRLAVEGVLEHLVMHQEDELLRLDEAAVGKQVVDLADQMIDGLHRLAAVFMHPFIVPAVEVEPGRSDELEVDLLARVLGRRKGHVVLRDI